MQNQRHKAGWPAHALLGLTILVTCVLYLSALQWEVNGSQHPYTTDVGEIQNALPRWGTIHYPGYPLCSLLGSFFVSLLRLAGIAPAAGSSLFSAVWGVATAALIYALARELGAAGLWAGLGALAAALSTSFWVDSSLAEIHTMGAALSLATLYLALRFGRYGLRRDLLWLAVALSQGLSHQRTTLLLAPAVLLLVYPRRQQVWRDLPAVAAVAAPALLVYLYLPIRAWQGADWTFGAVGTWQGFLSIFLDTKVSRVIALPGDLGGWLERLRTLGALLHDDLWLPVLALGVVGLWLGRGADAPETDGRAAWREPAALTLGWLPSLPLSLTVWEGRVSDALLAAKLPVALLAGVGLALAAQALARRGRNWTLVAAVLFLAVVAAEGWAHRPAVLAITRDPAAERVIALAEQVAQPQGGPPTTFLALWGHNYWALAYAQAYRGQLAGLTLVDHNADVAAIAARGERLLTFSETLYHLPLAWWDENLGRTHLSSPAPGILELRPEPILTVAVAAGAGLDLENGVRILSAAVEETGDRKICLRVHWQPYEPLQADYSVAVHLLANDPPQGPADILAQADRQHPVDGWYPTSRWQAGEVIRDVYVLTVPPGSKPQAVRVAMYQVGSDGQFHNSPWLTLPIG